MNLPLMRKKGGSQAGSLNLEVGKKPDSRDTSASQPAGSGAALAFFGCFFVFCCCFFLPPALPGPLGWAAGCWFVRSPSATRRRLALRGIGRPATESSFIATR